MNDDQHTSFVLLKLSGQKEELESTYTCTSVHVFVLSVTRVSTNGKGSISMKVIVS